MGPHKYTVEADGYNATNLTARLGGTEMALIGDSSFYDAYTGNDTVSVYGAGDDVIVGGKGIDLLDIRGGTLAASADLSDRD